MRTTTPPPSVGQALTDAELRAIEAAQPVTPFANLTCGVRTANGATWVGSERGLMFLAPGADRWKLFHSRRWLPNDHVMGIAVVAEEQDAAVVETKSGLVMIHTVPTTLEKKIAEIETNLRRWHVREGLVSETMLKEPGNLEGGTVQPSSDNDGLWTSMYVAAEAFRFGATGDPEAKKFARQSLDALMFQERITGIPGFVARSFVPIDDDPQRYGGEWHRSADGKWWWKGDTSSDELDGHYFAYGVYFDLCADEQEREEIREYVTRITDHILDHDYHYVGPPGKPTSWGVWSPERLNHDLAWIGDRGLNSLEILSHLKVAEHITGNPKYAQAAKELIDGESYEINTVHQKIVWPPHFVNHSDDELAFLAYYPLLMYEGDPRLRDVYLAGLERSWQIERPEKSPFFNFIYAAGRQASAWPKPDERPAEPFLAPEKFDRDACLEWFLDVPIETLSWQTVNTGRRDVRTAPHHSRADRPLALEVLPPSERRTMKWNGDPYELDGGGNGQERDDGTFILLPYWMGRYHRFID